MDTSDRYAWAKSRVEEVADGVYRIPLPMPEDGLRAVNVYAIVGEDRITLIDSGWAVPASRDALTYGLSQIDKSLGDIGQFLITHLHPDHYAQASVLREELDAPISVGEDEQDNLAGVRQNIADGGTAPRRFALLNRAGAAALVAQLPQFRIMPPDLIREWREPDFWLKLGSHVQAESRSLTVVPTPGHTRGHVVFHDESSKLLFAGDHILPQITPSIGLEVKSSSWPLQDYIDSLKLMKTRADAMLLPAHGPVWESAHLRVDQLIEHHDTRLAASRRAVEVGASSGYEVAQILKWTYHDRDLSELDVPNQTMAVGETMAHLDVLVLHGELSSKLDEDGIERYRSN